MTKERSEELKEWHENDGETHQFQIEKLIDVTDRFSAIQKENAELSIVLRDIQSKLYDEQQQNKRYREALEFYADEVNNRKARKSLRGE